MPNKEYQKRTSVPVIFEQVVVPRPESAQSGDSRALVTLYRQGGSSPTATYKNGSESPVMPETVLLKDEYARRTFVRDASMLHQEKVTLTYLRHVEGEALYQVSRTPERRVS